MLKKLIILFLSANLCAAEDIKKPEPSQPSNSAMKGIGLGLAGLAVYTVMPCIFGDSNTSQMTKFAGAALGAYGLYTLGGIINENIYPSEDKKVRAAEAHKRYTILTAEEDLRSCLMKNAYASKNAAGIPIVCENTARIYGVAAGTGALDAMTNTFKDTYRE